jgi:hypothetical protein
MLTLRCKVARHGPRLFNFVFLISWPTALNLEYALRVQEEQRREGTVIIVEARIIDRAIEVCDQYMLKS